MGQRDVVAYAECLKIHAHLGGKIDGCQEFKATGPGVNCSICGCHMNFHKKVVQRARVPYVTEVVYRECHKIHNLNGLNTKDGCKEFVPDYSGSFYGAHCAGCKCHQSFHRNELIKKVISAEPANAGRVKEERF